MYNLTIPCNLSHFIVPKYCYVSASLGIYIFVRCAISGNFRGVALRMTIEKNGKKTLVSSRRAPQEMNIKFRLQFIHKESGNSMTTAK